MPKQHLTDDQRINAVRALLPPAILLEEIPSTDAQQELVSKGRREVADILHGRDDRLVVVCGPCSIHNVGSALRYGEELAKEAEKHQKDLLIVMRAYFEKPRTVDGWKGLINDPRLDESFRINEGLRLARQLLHDLTDKGVLVACEFLDNVTPQYIAEFVTWVAIGARTSESQIHREFASGCSMPVGFKNGTTGRIEPAIDGIRAAAKKHWFLSVTKHGTSCILQTTGNQDCHLILRGGGSPNFDSESVLRSLQVLDRHHLDPRLMIDFSHGNSGKDHAKQRLVAENVASQVAGGQRGIFGVMLESHLKPGRQNLVEGVEPDPDLSITDACIGLPETREILDLLAEAVRQRRTAS